MFVFMHFIMTHLGIIDGLSLGASVGSGVQGVLAKHAKFGGHTISRKISDAKIYGTNGVVQIQVQPCKQLVFPNLPLASPPLQGY